MTIYKLKVVFGRETKAEHLFQFPDLCISWLENFFGDIPEPFKLWRGDMIFQQRIGNKTVRLEPLTVITEVAV